MATGEETRIVRHIMKRLKQDYDFDGYHVHGSVLQRTGEPDIDGSIWCGLLDRWLHLKLEVKTNTGSPTPIQIYRVREYHSRGYVAGIVTSYQAVLSLLDLHVAYEWEFDKVHSFRKIIELKGHADPYGLYGEWHEEH